jgi:protein farnesyltransferase/geranylgeranyltransferase type-1 subunit alpha
LYCNRYVENAVAIAPQNASPWNYLRGLVREAKGPAALPLISLKPFAQKYAPLGAPDNIQSSHALDLLADIHAEEQRAEEATIALDLLASRYDPIRANYWNWKKEQLSSAPVAAS